MDDIEKRVKEKQAERIKIFNNVFGTPEGKVVYKNLRSALVVNPELITNQYTNDDQLASHLQVGMRLAFKYLDGFLELETINK